MIQAGEVGPPPGPPPGAPLPHPILPKPPKAFLNSMVNQMKMPEFSGNESDFADFAREWQQYVRIMCPGGASSVGDALLLGLLKKALDHASRQRLISSMEANPDLKYSTFWKSLEADFGRDLTGVYRREWEKVTLGGVRNITPKMWRQFIADFELKARRVGDITDREKEDRIRRELPEDLRHRLGEENLRISSTRCWVKIPEPLPVPIDRLRPILAGILGRMDVPLERTSVAYILDCETKEQVEALRALDGWEMEGHRLQILPHNKGMTWKEMSQWVVGQLQLREEDLVFDSSARAINASTNIVAPHIPPSSRIPESPIRPPGVPPGTRLSQPPREAGPQFWENSGSPGDSSGWYDWEDAQAYPIQGDSRGKGRTSKGKGHKGSACESWDPPRGPPATSLGGVKGGRRRYVAQREGKDLQHP
jgi:hypothetical protein